MLSSCQSPPLMNVDDASKQTFRKDMTVEFDGIKYRGIGVLPRKALYKVKIYPPGKTDRLIWQTCNRDNTQDPPLDPNTKKRMFSNVIEFHYAPLRGIEDNRVCPIQIASLEEQKLRNGYAYFDIIDYREEISLPAHLRCNGDYDHPQHLQPGVGICQTAAGLTQQIFFNTEVVLQKVSPECDVMKSKDGFFWEWDAPKDKCVYYFVSNLKHKNGKRLAFRLNSIGFTAVPVYNY